MVTFDPDGRWREVIAKRMSISVDKDEKSNTYFMIPLVDNAHRNRLVAVASSLGVAHWVFGCVASAWHNNVRFWYVSSLGFIRQSFQFPSRITNFLGILARKASICRIKPFCYHQPATKPRGKPSFSTWRSWDLTAWRTSFSTFLKVKLRLLLLFLAWSFQRRAMRTRYYDTWLCFDRVSSSSMFIGIPIEIWL